jgi:hypothetical protein
MTEEWRPVVGWEGYEISSLGRLRSYRRPGKGCGSLEVQPKLRKPVTDQDGYKRAVLSAGKVKPKKIRGIHQLVAEAFLPDQHFEGAIVLHNNGSPADNRVENLRWGSWAENVQDRAVHGNLGVTWSADQVREVRRLYEMGFYQREIARVFKTTQSYVHNVISGKQRKDVA